ncbi:MAG: hypothetical protein KJ799_16655 [Bacteroidetes bacterium]|nr:hypothetical protein [Bacteroidota bacterium]MBU1679801.1 hypothetical protein [Bacteroidota bacterium]MBU2508329.1 hypothetical protein [Bacteroidota bacterium]
MKNSQQHIAYSGLMAVTISGKVVNISSPIIVSSETILLGILIALALILVNTLTIIS